MCLTWRRSGKFINLVNADLDQKLISQLLLHGISYIYKYNTLPDPTQVAHDPPLVSVTMIHPRHKEKDTSENIRATKGFTVNIISEPFVTNANYTSIDAPEDVDEWVGSGLTRVPSVRLALLGSCCACSDTGLSQTTVQPPRVKESAFSMECEVPCSFHITKSPPQYRPQLFHLHDISPPGSSKITATLVLGHIKLIHVRNSVLNQKGPVEASKLRAVSRLGGSMYGRAGDAFNLPRPTWKEEQELLKGR